MPSISHGRRTLAQPGGTREHDAPGSACQPEGSRCLGRGSAAHRAPHLVEKVPTAKTDFSPLAAATQSASGAPDDVDEMIKMDDLGVSRDEAPEPDPRLMHVVHQGSQPRYRHGAARPRERQPVALAERAVSGRRSHSIGTSASNGNGALVRPLLVLLNHMRGLLAVGDCQQRPA